MKIYTKTGDNGTTSLVGGTRVEKTDPRLEAYGTSDELNSYIGWLRARPDFPEEEQTILETIQQNLFIIGGALASDEKALPAEWNQIRQEDVKELEQWIDKINPTLEPIHNFILPGGSETVALCHVCRTICRRMERQILAIQQKQRPLVDQNMMEYVNRLSDMLYILSRKVAKINENAIFFWKKR